MTKERVGRGAQEEGGRRRSRAKRGAALVCGQQQVQPSGTAGRLPVFLGGGHVRLGVRTAASPPRPSAGRAPRALCAHHHPPTPRQVTSGPTPPTYP